MASNCPVKHGSKRIRVEKYGRSFCFSLNEKRRGGWLVRLGHPALERKADRGRWGRQGGLSFPSVICGPRARSALPEGGGAGGLACEKFTIGRRTTWKAVRL